MGACGSKSKKLNVQTVHVGGGELGKVQWVLLKGVEITNPSS